SAIRPRGHVPRSPRHTLLHERNRTEPTSYAHRRRYRSPPAPRLPPAPRRSTLPRAYAGTPARRRYGDPAPTARAATAGTPSKGETMSDESTATATPADPAAAEQATAPTEHPPAAIGTLWLAVLAPGWPALTVRSTLAPLATHDHTVSVTAAAIGLPAAISAALVGGAGIGLAARRLFRAHPERPIARFSAALGAGFLTGVATAATLVLTSTAEGSRIMVLSGTVAAAATIGGAIAGIRARPVVGAAVAASLALFLLTLLRELFTSPLLSLFGADEDPVSLLNAQRWLGLTSSLLGGVLGGLVAFGYLRRATRAGGAAPRWPAYLWAGGG